MDPFRYGKASFGFEAVSLRDPADQQWGQPPARAAQVARHSGMRGFRRASWSGDDLSTKTRMPRLFVAMDPPEEVRGVLAGIRFDLPGIRWLPPEQFHLTLRFLGEVPQDRVGSVAEVLAGVSGYEAVVGLEGIDAFPSVRRPRVLVIRLSEAPDLRALQVDVENAVVDLGFPPEDRPFTSHITLARFRDVESRHLERQLGLLAVPEIRFRMDDFFLYESRLFPSGAQYTRLRRFELAAHSRPRPSA